MSKAPGDVRRGAIWTLAAAVVSAGLQLAQTMLAARVLSAADLGVLAIANIMVAIAAAFQDLGLSSYCVHLGEVPRSTHATLYWISLALGLVVGGLIASLGGPLAAFYASPSLLELLPMVGANLVLLGASAQYQANLVRTFKAHTLARCEIAARVASFALVAWLLTTERLGVQALIVGLNVYSLGKLLLMVIVADKQWHPTLAFDRRVAPKAFRYGAYQAASQLLNQARTQADQLILGWALGLESLGIYSLAKELISFPLRFLQLLFARITLPGFAQVQHNTERLRHAVLVSLGRTATLSAAVYGGLSLFSPWIVELAYGDRFKATVPLVVALSVFGALRPIGANAGYLAQAVGKTGIEFRWNVICFAISLPIMMSIGFYSPSPQSFAVATSITQVFITGLAYPFFLRKLVDVGFFRYVWSWSFGLLLAVSQSSVALTWQVPPARDVVLSLQQAGGSLGDLLIAIRKRIGDSR